MAAFGEIWQCLPRKVSLITAAYPPCWYASILPGSLALACQATAKKLPSNFARLARPRPLRLNMLVISSSHSAHPPLIPSAYQTTTPRRNKHRSSSCGKSRNDHESGNENENENESDKTRTKSSTKPRARTHQHAARKAAGGRAGEIDIIWPGCTADIASANKQGERQALLTPHPTPITPQLDTKTSPIVMALGLTVTPNDPEANTDVPRLLSSTQTAREHGASPSPLVNDTALTPPPVPARAVSHKSRQSGEQALSYVSRPSDDTSTVDKYSQHLVYSSRPTSRQYIQPADGLNRPSPAALAGGHGRTVNKASSSTHGSPRRSSFAGSPPRSRSSQVGYPSAQHGAPITENHNIVHEPGATGKDAKQSHTFNDGVTLALDAEKALPSAGGPRHSQAVLSNLSSQDAIHSTYSYSSDDDEVEIDDFVLQQQTIRALLYLSTLALPISLALACYALIVLLVNILATPLHICFLPNRLYTQQLSARLTPPLRFQFRILYGPQVAASVHDVPPSSAWRLTMTHIVAPLLVMPLTMAAWTAAVVWGLSAMVADEQVGSASDHERRWAGKVVGVWVWWLEQNVIPESEEAGRHGRQDMRGVTEITRGGAKVERVAGSHAVQRK